MTKNKIDINLNETTHSKFSLMGHFSVSPDIKTILKGSTGIFEYSDGMAKIKMMPLLFTKKDKNAQFVVNDSDDATIFGFLEDGTYIRVNIFYSNYYVQHLPGSSVIYYVATDIDFSKSDFTCEEDYSRTIIRYDSLDEFADFIVPDLSNIDKSEGKSPLLLETNKYCDIFLKYECHEKENKISLTRRANVELEILIKKHSPVINSFINNFGAFLSVINNSRRNIISTRCFDKENNCILLHLTSSSKTKRNGQVDYSDGLTSEFNFFNYQDKLTTIVDNIFNANDQFNKLVQNYVFNIDDELNYDSALINYVSAIDIFMNGSTYHNGKKISSLFCKLKIWLQRFPDQLYGLLFDENKKDTEDEKRDYFLHSLVDTRDYLIHYEKVSSNYLIPEVQKVKYIKQLRTLIHIYILFIYGIPEKYLLKYYFKYEIEKIS